VANRLAKAGGFSVAVVERGGFYEVENGNLSQVPAFTTQFSSADPSSIQPLVDWGDVTVAQQV
jgi:choline dehydrogenase